MAVGTLMPKYRCHKEVWALKIKDVRERPDGAILYIEDPGFATIKIDQEYVSRNHPVAGGYYVVYEDGYQSFSPAKAFESGYTRI